MGSGLRIVFQWILEPWGFRVLGLRSFGYLASELQDLADYRDDRFKDSVDSYWDASGLEHPLWFGFRV